MAGMGGGAAENWGPPSQRRCRPLSSTWDCPARWSVTWMEVQGGLWISLGGGLLNGQWAVTRGQRLQVVLTQSLGMGWGWRHQAAALCKSPWCLVDLSTVTQLSVKHKEHGCMRGGRAPYLGRGQTRSPRTAQAAR